MCVCVSIPNRKPRLSGKLSHLTPWLIWFLKFSLGMWSANTIWILSHLLLCWLSSMYVLELSDNSKSESGQWQREKGREKAVCGSGEEDAFDFFSLSGQRFSKNSMLSVNEHSPPASGGRLAFLWVMEMSRLFIAQWCIHSAWSTPLEQHGPAVHSALQKFFWKRKAFYWQSYEWCHSYQSNIWNQAGGLLLNVALSCCFSGPQVSIRNHTV